MDNRSNQGQFTFSKEERITHKGDIEKLFISGRKLNLFPFDIRYYSGNMGSLNKVLISVSKKNIKSAVKRNLIKRRVREQVKSSGLLKIIPKGVSFFLIYTSKEIISSSDLKDALESLVKNFDSGVK